jgi:hypothetical protein
MTILKMASPPMLKGGAAGQLDDGHPHRPRAVGDLELPTVTGAYSLPNALRSPALPPGLIRVGWGVGWPPRLTSWLHMPRPE